MPRVMRTSANVKATLEPKAPPLGSIPCVARVSRFILHLNSFLCFHIFIMTYFGGNFKGVKKLFPRPLGRADLRTDGAKRVRIANRLSGMHVSAKAKLCERGERASKEWKRKRTRILRAMWQANPRQGLRERGHRNPNTIKSAGLLRFRSQWHCSPAPYPSALVT